jgi:dTDP-4-amino-4,6-dideoxygalactose transaminase
MPVPVGQFAMTDVSKSLYYAYDQPVLVQKTRNNYEVLQKHLEPIRKLEPGVSPLGFPMLHEGRDRLLHRLIQEKIFPPIHWSLKKVPKDFSDSYWVSEREITLPCDHRYDAEDMKKIIKCVKTSYS